MWINRNKKKLCQCDHDIKTKVFNTQPSKIRWSGELLGPFLNKTLENNGRKLVNAEIQNVFGGIIRSFLVFNYMKNCM